MNQAAYSWKRDKTDVKEEIFSYHFISDGKKKIEKVVTFTFTQQYWDNCKIYNVALLDQVKEGYSDTNQSRNGDIVLLFSTVVRIIQDFLTIQVDSYIILIGNNEIKNRSYQRIISSNKKDFEKDFIILGIRSNGEEETIEEFEPDRNYIGFLIGSMQQKRMS